MIHVCTLHFCGKLTYPHISISSLYNRYTCAYRCCLGHKFSYRYQDVSDLSHCLHATTSTPSAARALRRRRPPKSTFPPRRRTQSRNSRSRHKMIKLPGESKVSMRRRFLAGLIMLQGQLAGLARRRTGRQATASPTGMHFSSRAPLSQDSRRICHISDREE